MRADDRDESASPPPPLAGADKSFLGAEFLTWLFFHLEHEGMELSLPDAFGGDTGPSSRVRFQIGKRAVLRAVDKSGARVALSGSEIDDASELLCAVRRGAQVLTIELAMLVGERVLSFTLNAEDGSVSGVKFPDLFSVPDGPSERGDDDEGARALPRPSFDDVLTLRMRCLDDIDRVVDALYTRFVTRRIARAWQTEEVAAIRRHIQKGLKARLGA